MNPAELRKLYVNDDLPMVPTSEMLRVGAELVAEAHREGESVSPYVMWRDMALAYRASQAENTSKSREI